MSDGTEKELADSPSIGCESESGIGDSIPAKATGEGATGGSGSGNDEGITRIGHGEGMEDTDSGRNSQPEHEQSDISSEPSGGDGEDMGDSSTEGFQERQESQQSQSFQATEQSVGGHEGESMGNTECKFGPEGSGECDEHRNERQGDAIASSSSEGIGEGGPGESEVESEMGGNPDGITLGLVLSERTGLSYQELEEIFDWMRLGRSRVEELRLLGNGVVPQCVEKAFRTLYTRLEKLETEYK